MRIIVGAMRWLAVALIVLLSLDSARAQFVWTYSEDKTVEIQGFKAFPRLSPGTETTWTAQDVRSVGLSPLETTRLIPSLQINGSEFAGPTPTIFLRGSPSVEVLILWNGIELNDPSSVGGGASPLLVQREFSHQMRVTKGPSTLLDGSGAMAGVLDWRRSPSVSSRFVVGGGSLANQSGLIEFSQGAGLDSPSGASSDSLASAASWGLGLSHSRQQGLSTTSAVGPDGSREKDTQSFTSGSLFFEKRINPDLDFEFVGMLSGNEQDDDLFGIQDHDARSSSQIQAGRFAFKQRLSENDRLEFRYQRSSSQRESRNDPIEASSGYLENNSGERSKKSLIWQRAGLIESLGVDSEFHAETTDEALSGKSIVETTPPTVIERKQAAQAVALVLSTKGRNRQLGLRMDQPQNQNENRVSVLSWQFMNRWKNLTEGVHTYLAISEGHRFPSLYQRYSFFGNSDLQMQALRAYEVGIEGAGELASPREWKLGLFQNDYSKMIDYDFATLKFQNRGSVQIQGLEGEMVWNRLTDRWQLGFLILSAQDLVKNQRLVRRPNYSGSVLWVHELSDRWKSTWTLRWLDSRPDSISASQTLNLPPSWKSDLNFQYHPLGPVHWNFYLKNIFNSNSEDVATYSTVPRSIFVSMESAF